MTDIELAKKWVEKEYDELRYEKCERKDFVFTFYELKEMGKQAFLAGFNAKTQWHDLRKNPNDLPERISFLSKTVINQIGTPCHYNYALECWQNWSNTEIETPITWCELPKFEG